MEQKLSFSLFKTRINQDFEIIINKFSTPRTLTIPEYLINFINQLFFPEKLNELIQSIVPFKNIESSNQKRSIFFLIYNDINSIREVCKIFKKIPNYTKILLLIPRFTNVCQQIFSEYGFIPIQGLEPSDPQIEISIFDFHSDFLFIEEDYFLLPCINSFYNIFLNHDDNDLYNSSRSLLKIQSLFGKIPKIQTIGKKSLKIKELTNDLSSQNPSLYSTIHQIDSLIIIDREIDLITPLLTQTSFEGTIDEQIGIDYGICKPPKGLFTSSNSFKFNDNIEFIKNVRKLHINEFAQYFKEKLLEINNILKEFHEETNFKKKNENILKVNQISTTKNQYESYSSLLEYSTTQIFQKKPHFSNIIKMELEILETQNSNLPFYENLITLYNDWESVLRLLFLESLSNISHSKKIIENIQKEICYEFGLNCQKTLIFLEELKLLSNNLFPWKFSTIFKELNILPQKEIDYLLKIYNGYIPISIRIIQNFIKNDILLLQKLFDEKKFPITSSGEILPKIDEEPIKILVFFVGGITLSEITFLKYLSKNFYNNKIEFIIGSTEKINQKIFLNSICHFLQ